MISGEVVSHFKGPVCKFWPIIMIFILVKAQFTALKYVNKGVFFFILAYTESKGLGSKEALFGQSSPPYNMFHI